MAGRKLSFKTYLANEAKRLTSSKDNRLSSFCNNLTHTALPYVYTYAFYYSDLFYFLKSLNNDKFKNVELPALPDDYRELRRFKETDLEYYKVLQGYNTYLDHSSADSKLKKLYHSKIKESVEHLDRPLCSICTETGVSQGNLTMFLKGDLSKLGLDKCRALNDALN